MVDPFSLCDRTILVTGASSGIGAAVSHEAAKFGATIVATGRNKERLENVKSSLSGNNHSIIIADLSTEIGVDELVSKCPVIDGLVCNAGITKTLPVQFITSEIMESIFSINTFAPILLFKKLLKSKKISSGASVVFTSSMTGVSSVMVGNSLYSASKGAVSAFVRNAALELAGRKIRVNAVCPGMVDTDILENNSMISKTQLDADMKNYPLGRYGKPEDIAYAIVYLLSSASSWMTGNNLLIDGGYSLK